MSLLEQRILVGTEIFQSITVQGVASLLGDCGSKCLQIINKLLPCTSGLIHHIFRTNGASDQGRPMVIFYFFFYFLLLNHKQVLITPSVVSFSPSFLLMFFQPITAFRRSTVFCPMSLTDLWPCPWWWRLILQMGVLYTHKLRPEVSVID